ncbi:type 4a pilus biogenesis protein PilO [Geomonas agri]|uniref:type 4a pilus biogenesis protein PilO n=1 Tax=Geomonas agri TaxID=2873702 RepID=UPI001CD69D43|nr:type 4a pilus biogenesis protein PilO [Geomonas agri]
MNYQMLLDMLVARRKSFAFIGFLALLVLAAELYISSYQRPELGKVQQAWFAKRDALARGETQADATKYQQGMRDLDEFRKYLVPKKELPALLTRLYDTAKKNSVALNGITYKPGKEKVKGSQVLTYGISFNATGKYGSVKSFLADLARLREMLVIEGVSLSNTSATEENVELRISTTVYLTEGA